MQKSLEETVFEFINTLPTIHNLFVMISGNKLGVAAIENTWLLTSWTKYATSIADYFKEKTVTIHLGI